MLKPQDIVILLKIISAQAKDMINPLPQKDLATYLCMSASEVSEGTKRLLLSGLLAPVSGVGQKPTPELKRDLFLSN